MGNSPSQDRDCTAAAIAGCSRAPSPDEAQLDAAYNHGGSGGKVTRLAQGPLGASILEGLDGLPDATGRKHLVLARGKGKGGVGLGGATPASLPSLSRFTSGVGSLHGDVGLNQENENVIQFNQASCGGCGEGVPPVAAPDALRRRRRLLLLAQARRSRLYLHPPCFPAVPAGDEQRAAQAEPGGGGLAHAGARDAAGQDAAGQQRLPPAAAGMGAWATRAAASAATLWHANSWLASVGCVGTGAGSPPPPLPATPVP